MNETVEDAREALFRANYAGARFVRAAGSCYATDPATGELLAALHPGHSAAVAPEAVRRFREGRS